jgi:hypothetical protein
MQADLEEPLIIQMAAAEAQAEQVEIQHQVNLVTVELEYKVLFQAQTFILAAAEVEAHKVHHITQVLEELAAAEEEHAVLEQQEDQEEDLL